MFDGISRSDPPASGSPSDGSPAGALTPEMQAFPLDGAGIHLRMDHREGRTRLTRLLQKAPMRALLPQVSAQEPPTACLTNTAGGLVGGDRFSITVEAGENAALLAMAQAAEKVYRSAGPDVRLDI
ncbi:MAG: urease accessory protein UreD, partial [Rhodospirillaceae bacterium]